MKRLQLQAGESTSPAPASFPTEKERLVRDIRDFIGEDGDIPMEHGYRPTLNAYAFDQEGMLLRFPIGKERHRRIQYSEMDEDMLTKVILELFRYFNWCHLYDHNSESRFTIQRKGEKDIEVTAVPLHAIRFNKFLSDLVRKEEGIDYKVSWCANIGQEVDYTHN